MNISFILPFSGHDPVGGFKVVYEYANGLVNRGHTVTVYHAPYRRRGDASPALLARQAFVYTGKALGMAGGFRPDSWFTLDRRVRLEWKPSLDRCWVSPADAVIATSWETAEWVARYSEDQGRKYYLIQHKESTFPGTDPDRVMATWKLPFTKIVIARWLENIASDLGEGSVYIPNGLDFSAFGLDTPIENRNPHHLIMLYHHLDWKGSRDGLEAVQKVKREVPQLNLTLFGTPFRPEGLPEWISYYQKPAQTLLRRLYNDAALFVGPSWAEGWPLPPAEATQCGAALCITDIGGHREYAVHEDTALLSPPRDPDALAMNILSLVKHNDQRISMAKRANAYIRQFTWETAVSALEKCLST